MLCIETYSEFKVPVSKSSLIEYEPYFLSENVIFNKRYTHVPQKPQGQLNNSNWGEGFNATHDVYFDKMTVGSDHAWLPVCFLMRLCHGSSS